MRTLFTGEPFVAYAQIYVDGSGSQPCLDECFAGQANGLCGAAVPGFLFLITGLHTGNVGLTIESHDAEPPLDDTWEEIVEASFRPRGQRVGLCQWAGEAWWDLDLPECDHRVRYCAINLDEARAADTRSSDEPDLDLYLLQFWPAPPADDRVLKQTSKVAAYWHQRLLA